MKSKVSTALIIYLALMTSIGQVANYWSFPMFTEISRSYDLSMLTIRATLTYSLLGALLAQIPAGFAVNQLGTKRVFVVAWTIFFAATLLCSFAPSIGWLHVARFLQGLSGCALLVVASTISRARFHGIRFVGITGAISALYALICGISPIVSGAIATFDLWRTGYIMLGFVAVPLWVLSRMCSSFHITRKPKNSDSHITAELRQLALLLQDKNFVFMAIATGLISGCVFAFHSASPQIFIDKLDLTPFQYGMLFPMLTVPGVIVGSLLSRSIASRIGVYPLFCVSAFICILSSFISVTYFIIEIDEIFVLIASTMLYFTAMGLCIPCGTSLATENTQNKEGTVMAMFALIQMAIGLMSAWISTEVEYIGGFALLMLLANATSLMLAIMANRRLASVAIPRVSPSFTK